METVTKDAAAFLDNLFSTTGLELHTEIKEGVSGPILDLEGPDADMLQSQTGELLEALQHVVNQVFGKELTGARLVCDVHGFRATREAELQAMANLAAARVRQTGLPFTFEPMSANERRIIHMTLAESPDLYTESIGEGNDRKLKVGPKPIEK
jgi:spoIIIJ-associated protein